MTVSNNRRPWRVFAATLCAAAAAVGAVLYGFVLLLDPYGLRATRPIMDLNQRFMYPQIVRSRRFDAALFGTSTVRLLDPDRLNAVLGVRFANLGLNAGTPWEQMQLADLFLRQVPEPKALVFGLDRNWCEADADRKRLTFRAFPPWLYDESRLDDYAKLLNLRSVEIAGRLALHHAGMMPERIRGDGYEIFVPDETLYDVEKARFHIYGPGGKRAYADNSATTGHRPAASFPAFGWLDALLARVPGSTAVMLTMMPIHIAAQAHGSETGLETACKERIADLGRKHGAAVVDFRIPSPVTTEDSNYWDPLHYRVGTAERIVAALAQAWVTGGDAADGFYRVLTRPAR
jgi:hypothetical protein